MEVKTVGVYGAGFMGRGIAQVALEGGYDVVLYNHRTPTLEKGVAKCSQCPEFPCGKIQELLARSAAYQQRCREVCTPQEYAALEAAFFHKEENLRK